MKQESFLGELEEKICNILNLHEPDQYNSTFFEDRMGNLMFAKESSHGSGKKLKKITKNYKKIL